MTHIEWEMEKYAPTAHPVCSLLFHAGVSVGLAPGVLAYCTLQGQGYV